MALEVEDGTGKANAESYISVADANTRHTAFGNTDWTGTDAVEEAAAAEPKPAPVHKGGSRKRKGI